MRELAIARDDAELLVDLLDTVRGTDFRLDAVNDEIRRLFGMSSFQPKSELENGKKQTEYDSSPKLIDNRQTQQ